MRPFAGVVTVAATVTVAILATFAVVYLAVSPPAAIPVRQPGLLPSYHPGGWYPDLSRAREHLLTAFMLAAPPLAYALTLLLRRLLAPPHGSGRIALSPTAATVSGVAFAVVLLCATYAGHNTQPQGTGDYFGWDLVTAATSLAIAAAFMLTRRALQRSPARAHAVAALVLWAALVPSLCYIVLSLLQFPSSVRDRTNVSLTIDDLLAASNGIHALGDNLPRYSGLLGEIVYWVQPLHTDPVIASFTLLLVLDAAVLCCIYAVCRMAGFGAAGSLGAVAFCFFCSVGGHAVFLGAMSGRADGFFLNAFDYPGLFPVRMFAPFVCGALTVALCLRPTLSLCLALGASMAVFTANELTFGLAGSAVSLATLTLVWYLLPGSTERAKPRFAAAVAGGAVLGAACVTSYSLLVTGAPPRVESIVWGLRHYAATGVFSYPVDAVWNVQVMPFLVFLFAFALGVGAESIGRSERERRAVRASLIYFSLVGFIGYLYYLDRPVPSTLVVATFIPAAICLVLMLAAFRASEDSDDPLTLPVRLACLVVAVTLGLQALAVRTIPSEFARVVSGFDAPPSLTMDDNRRSPHAAAVERFVREHPVGPEIMIVDQVNGRILALESGTHDVNPLFPNIMLAAEVERFLEVAAQHGCPPVFATVESPPELIAGIENLGYTKADSVPYIALYQNTRKAACATSSTPTHSMSAR